MKKQGPPQPLSEEHFAKLKRKAGLPVDPVVEAPEKKKRKTNTKERTVIEPKRNGVATKKDVKKTKVTKPMKAAAPAPEPKANGKVKKSKKAPVPALEDVSDEEMDDEFDLEDLEDDSDLGGGAGLGDDFLGSDDDDSVFDSDEDAGGKNTKAMFSEDEDESDAEEKLTAANIAGLSRKLDAQMAEEAAEAEAEMAQEALQTNIHGDKPHILSDEDSDDELSKKTNALLAPDLQLLRTRIT
jgi:ribosomal RNA methyltransferase Nop2